MFNNISDAYMNALHTLYNFYEFVNPSIQKREEKNENYYFNRGETKEILGFKCTIVKPKRNDNIITKSESRNKVISEYAKKERDLYDKGDIFNMGSISKVWDIIKNPDGSINANYGYMVYHLKDAGNKEFDSDIMSQWEWAKSRLKLCKNTGQAYLHFNRPKDQWKNNLDQPCTMFIQFIIRENKLHLYGYMRSNDVVYGMPYNILYFIELMYRMRDELLEVYPMLEIGNYIHNTTSLHYYTKHESKVKDMLGIK